ncbi:MAG: glycosyl transferase group 1 [Bacteroidota bacterium]|nr:glycosyl transferase group 1 [Bacteroidota bacterium]
MLQKGLQVLWKLKGIRQLQRKLSGRVYKSDFEWVPGMTTLEERNWFYQCAKEREWKGHIVDLGSWLGSTTVPLLKGLAESKTENAVKVYAFDRFIWNKEMADVATWLPGAPQLAVGSNFKSVLEENVKPFGQRAEVIEADLKTYQWNKGEIELLLVDAMKTRSLTVQIARSFFPSLKPGAVLIFQDFAHFFTPWIHVLTYQLRDKLKPVYNVPYSGSMSFDVLERIDLAELSFLDDIDSYPAIDDAFNYSLKYTNAENKAKVIAAKAMWYVYQNNLKKAKEIYDKEIGPEHYKLEDVAGVREYINRTKTIIFFEK